MKKKPSPSQRAPRGVTCTKALGSPAAAAAPVPGSERRKAGPKTRRAMDFEKRRWGDEELGNDRSDADGHGVAKTKRREKSPLPRKAVCVARGFLQPVCSLLHSFLPWLRGLKGWSLDDVASITHLDKSYLCNLENRKESNPSLDVISRLADAFGLKLHHFVKTMERFASREASFMPDMGRKR